MAVLGAGNAGLALAGDLALKSIPVRLYEHPGLVEGFAPIKAAKGLKVDDGSGKPPTPVRFADATHDLAADADADADAVAGRWSLTLVAGC